MSENFRFTGFPKTAALIVLPIVLPLALNFSLPVQADSISTPITPTRITTSTTCIPGARPILAADDPSSLRVQSIASPSALLMSHFDEWKKLSRLEFTKLPIQPTGTLLLPRGTELNVVADLHCLVAGGAEASPIGWLKELGRSTKSVRQGSGSRSFSWTLDRDWDFQELQDTFERETCVQIVSPESLFYVRQLEPQLRTTDPLSRDQAHLTSIRYAEALNGFLPAVLIRAPISIAVIDTGVDFYHPDLQMNQWVNLNEVSGNGRDDDGNGYVDDYSGYNFATEVASPYPQGDWPNNKHGTHVAGLAASRIDNAIGGIGVNGVAKIMSLNVFGPNGFTRSSILENAIRYAGDQNADVINLSLGGREYSRSMRAALQYAIDRGSFIVAAAGNDGVELCDDPLNFDFVSPAVYGSSLGGMIVTASTDVLSGRISLFSNFSPRLVEFSSPGAYTSNGTLIGLLSTIPTQNYDYLAGTSMAAPVLSGAAALAISWLKAFRYQVTPQRVEQIMKASARRDPGLAGSVQEGRALDLMELLNYLKRHFPAS